MTRRRGDRGSGTLLGIVAALLLLSSGVASWSVAAVVVAHQRASVAADLGALAGATGGCAAAERIVRANGARLDSCRHASADVVVEVSMPSPELLRRLGLPEVRVTSSARAGTA